mgnify:CR=1 FL=1
MVKNGRSAGSTMAQDASVLAGLLARRLKQEGVFIATAESCTGGMLASALTDIQGASRWFKQGWITYSNEAKVTLLGVEENIFGEDEGSAGAVSSEVAEAMAEGAAKKANAQVAIAITGIAGPTGGTETKEVGLVWVGVHLNGDTISVSAEFGHGDRHSNKVAFTTFALRSVLELWDETVQMDTPDEETVESDEEVEIPKLDIALDQVGDEHSRWQGEVTWSEGEQPPNGETSIPDDDISWDDDE